MGRRKSKGPIRFLPTWRRSAEEILRTPDTVLKVYLAMPDSAVEYYASYAEKKLDYFPQLYRDETDGPNRYYAPIPSATVPGNARRAAEGMLDLVKSDIDLPGGTLYFIREIPDALAGYLIRELHMEGITRHLRPLAGFANLITGDIAILADAPLWKIAEVTAHELRHIWQLHNDRISYEGDISTLYDESDSEADAKAYAKKMFARWEQLK